MTIHKINSFSFWLKTKISFNNFLNKFQLSLIKRALIFSSIIALYGGLFSHSNITAYCNLSLGNSFSFHAQIEWK